MFKAGRRNDGKTIDFYGFNYDLIMTCGAACAAAAASAAIAVVN